MTNFASYFVGPAITPFIQLVLAMLFGMILGIERILAGRTAGPRTYGLVSLGSCLLTILSVSATGLYPSGLTNNSVTIVAAVVSGIGFLGAGLIIFRNSKLSGLTTAAGIWVAAAIGIGVGFGFYLISFFATFLTLFLFSTMWYAENKIKKFTDRQQALMKKKGDIHSHSVED